MFQPVRKEAGYPIIEASNDQILPVSELTGDNQKLVVFDDFICEKNQRPLIDYFIRGRHKNCSVIYLSQSYYKTPKDMRLNCSHFSIYDFPCSNEKCSCAVKTILRKKDMKRQQKIHFHFCT